MRLTTTISVVLMVLKLTGVIYISWLGVIAPMLIVIVFFILLGLIGLLFDN